MNTTFYHTIKLFACGWLVAVALSFSACSGTDQVVTDQRGALVGTWSVNEHRVEILDGNIRKDTTLQRNVSFSQDGTASIGFSTLLNWVYQNDPERIALFNEEGILFNGDFFPIEFEVTEHTNNTWKLHGEKKTAVFENDVFLYPQLIVDWTLEK